MPSASVSSSLHGSGSTLMTVLVPIGFDYDSTWRGLSPGLNPRLECFFFFSPGGSDRPGVVVFRVFSPGGRSPRRDSLLSDRRIRGPWSRRGRAKRSRWRPERRARAPRGARRATSVGTHPHPPPIQTDPNRPADHRARRFRNGAEADLGRAVWSRPLGWDESLSGW